MLTITTPTQATDILFCMIEKEKTNDTCYEVIVFDNVQVSDVLFELRKVATYMEENTVKEARRLVHRAYNHSIYAIIDNYNFDIISVNNLLSLLTIDYLKKNNVNYLMSRIIDAVKMRKSVRVLMKHEIEKISLTSLITVKEAFKLKTYDNLINFLKYIHGELK